MRWKFQSSNSIGQNSHQAPSLVANCAQMYLQPHYDNGVFYLWSNVLLAQGTKRCFRGHSSITSSRRWVGGVKKWKFLMIYSTVNHQRVGWVGLKKSKTWWRNTWMVPLLPKMAKEWNGDLLPKLFRPTVRKVCSSDGEKLLKIEAEGQEFAKILRSREQFIQIMKRKNNCW